MSLQLDTEVYNFIGALVSVAWSRHKKLWSIRMGQKVIAYTDALLLSSVSFVVSEPARQRVLATGKRNVHAFAKGTLLNFGTAPLWPNMQRVSYNPYRNPFFVNSDTGEAVHSAAWAIAGTNGLFIHN